MDELKKTVQEKGLISNWHFWVSDPEDIYKVEPVLRTEYPRIHTIPGGGLQDEISWEEVCKLPQLQMVLEPTKSLLSTGLYDVTRVHLIHKKSGHVIPWHRDLGEAHLVLYHQLACQAITTNLSSSILKYRYSPTKF